MRYYTLAILAALISFISGCVTTEPKSTTDFSAPSAVNSDTTLNSTTVRNARKALVIGNKTYPSNSGFVELTNPVNDASAMAGRLADYGFTVTTIIDANKHRFEAAIDTFVNSLNPSDVALIYYSGHGAAASCPKQSNETHNYLVPVGAAINGVQDLCQYGVSVQVLLDRLTSKRTSVNILLLDACREYMTTNYAYNTESKGTEAKGFVEMRGVRTFIGYASEPGKMSFGNNNQDGHSWYTGSLLKMLTSPYDDLPIEILFKNVQDDVGKIVGERGQKQLPWVSSEGLIGNFCFRTPCLSITELASLREKQRNVVASGALSKEPAVISAPPTSTGNNTATVTRQVAVQANDALKIDNFTTELGTNGKLLALGFSTAQQAYEQLPPLSECTTIGKKLGADPRVTGNSIGFWARSSDGAIGVCLRNNDEWIVNSHSVSGKFYLLKAEQNLPSPDVTTNLSKPEALGIGDVLTNIWTAAKNLRVSQ